MAHTRPQLAGAAALILMTLDLAAANSRYVMTVEQSMFDGQPALVQIIEKAEADRDPPVPGPFRVHRMPSWSPMGLERARRRRIEIATSSPGSVRYDPVQVRHQLRNRIHAHAWASPSSMTTTGTSPGFLFAR